VRRQKAEGRRQKAEGRRQKAEGRIFQINQKGRKIMLFLPFACRAKPVLLP